MQRAFFRVLFSAWLLAGCGFSLPSLPSLPSSSSSKEPPVREDPEVKISRDFRREAKKKLKLVHNPEVERYVNRIGQRILSVMGPQPYDYRFFVIEDSELNAFAIPGGSIYVHTGLLERITNTDELAGVLGHEIIHVKGHHMARLSGPDPLSLLALAGIFLGKGGAGAQAAGAAAQGLSAMRELSYSRALEQEADNLGTRYMAEAGYNPNEVLSFLKIMDQERVLNPTDVPPYLMTHPITQERLANATLLVRSLNPAPQRLERPDPLKRIQTILRLERHESDAVVAESEKLLRQNPKNAEAAQMLGLAYYSKGRWEQARESYERAKALKPDSPGIERDLGRVYTQVGDFQSARQAFERSLNLEPQEPLNYLFLGELFEKQSNFLEAANAFFRAQTLWPLWPEALYRLGVTYGKMRPPRLGDAYANLGRSELLQDEDEKAIADLERAVKALGPNSPQGQAIKDEVETIKARGK